MLGEVRRPHAQPGLLDYSSKPAENQALKDNMKSDLTPRTFLMHAPGVTAHDSPVILKKRRKFH